MFDHFEDDCTRAMNEARKESQRLGHGYLDAEHILLGLFRVADCTAVRMLRALALDVDAIRGRLLEVIPVANNPSLLMPFTNRSKRVLELAMQQAGNLGDRYVGTEHMLLALVLLGDGDGHLALFTPLGADFDRLRSVMDTVPRGQRAPSNQGKQVPPSPEDARVDGSTAQKLFHAAQVCDQVKEELIHDQRFEQAVRARDIGHWIRQLARDLLGEAS